MCTAKHKCSFLGDFVSQYFYAQSDQSNRFMLKQEKKTIPCEKVQLSLASASVHCSKKYNHRMVDDSKHNERLSSITFSHFDLEKNYNSA